MHAIENDWSGIWDQKDRLDSKHVTCTVRSDTCTYRQLNKQETPTVRCVHVRTDTVDLTAAEMMIRFDSTVPSSVLTANKRQTTEVLVR